MEEEAIERTNILKDGKDIKDINSDMKKTEYAHDWGDEITKERVVRENYDSYYWLDGAIALLPTTVRKNKGELKVIDYQYILKVQYLFLELYRDGKTIEFIKKEIENL